MSIVYVDEVGYSSIFGPVLAAAVAIDQNFKKIDGVNDSKKLTKKKREKLYPILQNKLIYDFGSASPKKVERLNIFYARYEAMRIAVFRLFKRGVKIDKVIVDGKYIIPNLVDIKQEAVIKADEIYWQVGAASILAKVKRDNLISRLSSIKVYSYYDLQNNAGYYTPKHRMGIILHGPTDLHRKNFAYFKYCLFCHNKFKDFINQGNTAIDYFQYEKEEIKKHGSFYKFWKNGTKDLWKEIPYGQGG
jgi:ribonuclease HII